MNQKFLGQSVVSQQLLHILQDRRAYQQLLATAWMGKAQHFGMQHGSLTKPAAPAIQ